MFLQDRLETLGFETGTASQGEEGLKVLDTEPISGILLDLEMPVMDGLTVLSHLQVRFQNIPVIVMSADPTQSTMVEAIKKGACDYLLKPFSLEILRHKCHRLFA